MSLFQSFLLPTTVLQWGGLFASLMLVFVGFQLLPFKWRKQIGVIQIIALLVIAYLIYLGGHYLLKHHDIVQAEKASNEISISKPENWVAMQVKVKALNLRTCKTTYCDSIVLLPIGKTVMVDLNSNDNNWLNATVDGQSGFVSSIYLEREK